MSQSRLREIAEKLQSLNEQAQSFRKTIADKRSTAELVKEARTSFNKVMDEVDVLTAEREEIRENNQREARAERLDLELRGTHRPPQDPIGGSELPAAIVAYDRALRTHGVSVSKRGSELVFKNHALEHVSADIRQTIEDLNYRYFEAFRRYSISFQMGDTNRCPAEDRAIIFGQDPEFRGFLQGSQMEFSDREKRDMGIGTLSLGGYFVPKGFVYEVEEAMKYFGPMLQIADIMDTSTGQPLPYPTDNDTSVSGEIVGEGQQVTDKDVAIGQVLFGAYKFSTKMIKLSLELLQDSAFPMEGYLKKKMATRLGRAYNTYFTTGSGTNQPNGIVTAVVANCGTPSATPGQAYGTPLIASGSASNTGGAETGGTSIGSKDLDNLEHTVDPLYRRGAAYMFHDQTRRVIKVLLDKYGRPLWKPGLATGDPDRINNYPYHVNNDMTATPGTATTNQNTVLFGALDKYVIRRVKELGILTLRERFADYGQLAYIGFSRADGQLLDAGTPPICYLQQARS